MSQKEIVLDLIKSKHLSLVKRIFEYVDSWRETHDRHLDIFLNEKIGNESTRQSIIFMNSFTGFKLQIDLCENCFNYDIPIKSDSAYYGKDGKFFSNSILETNNKSVYYTTLVYEIANILVESQNEKTN